MIIKEIFGDKRIVGLAGEKSSGKTNNLMYLLKEFRQEKKDVKIYVYGLDEITFNYIRKLGNVFEISSLSQLTNKSDCLIILDEFQKLNLGNRRYTDLLNKFIDFIYHSNNWVIFTSPNIREFNSIIGSKIERWALKTLRLRDIINGSHLKEAVLNYNGKFKYIDDLQIPKNQILILNDDFDKTIECEYIKEIDNKVNKRNIFV